MQQVTQLRYNYETYNFYIVSTNFSPKKKIQNNIDINFRIDRYTLHDEIFSISAWNLDTLSLAWSIKQEVYTENKNFPDCLMKKFKKEKPALYTKLSNITHYALSVMTNSNHFAL